MVEFHIMMERNGVVAQDPHSTEFGMAGAGPHLAPKGTCVVFQANQPKHQQLAMAVGPEPTTTKGRN